MRYGDDPTPLRRDMEEWRAVTTIEYGLRPDVALAAYVPLVYRETEYNGPVPAGHHAGGDTTTADFGLDDVTLTVKWRAYRHDSSPIDTARLALVGGVEVPAGADEFSGDSFDPLVGGVFTAIRGRHGFNAELLYKLTTDGMPESEAVRAGEGQADALFYNGSYLYRVDPATFSATSTGALYGVLEANGVYETNGDHELLVAPGLLYEARGYAIEASLQLPLWQDLDHRPETDFTLTLGVRLLF